jgi:hypothetical protein
MVSPRATVVTGALVLMGLLAAAVTFATNSGDAQPAGQAAEKEEKGNNAAVAPLANQGGTKKPAAPKRPLQILEEWVDMGKFQKPMDLKEALGVLQKDLADRGMPLDIIVDADAFREQYPDVPDSYPFESKVSLPQVPRKLTVERTLSHLLAHVPTGDAAYVVYNDHILITTEDRTNTDALLLQQVTGVYDNRPLAEVVLDLAEKKGTTIVLDRRVGDKEQRPISIRFQSNTTLAGALRVIAEMADLKVLVVDGIVFVTTPAHAEQLRKEQKQQEKDGYPMWPSSQFLDPRPAMPFTMPSAHGNPGVPGVPGFPGTPGFRGANPLAPTPPNALGFRRPKEAA